LIRLSVFYIDPFNCICMSKRHYVQCFAINYGINLKTGFTAWTHLRKSREAQRLSGRKVYFQTKVK